MRKILAAALLTIGLLAGCTSLRDARGPSEICEVHHAFMRSVELPGPKAGVQLPPEYIETGIKTFPHAMPDYLPDSRHRVMLFICDDCVRAQRVWKLQHPGAVP